MPVLVMMDGSIPGDVVGLVGLAVAAFGVAAWTWGWCERGNRDKGEG